MRCLGSPAICLEELPTRNSRHSLIPQIPDGIQRLPDRSHLSIRFNDYNDLFFFFFFSLPPPTPLCSHTTGMWHKLQPTSPSPPSVSMLQHPPNRCVHHIPPSFRICTLGVSPLSLTTVVSSRPIHFGELSAQRRHHLAPCQTARTDSNSV